MGHLVNFLTSYELNRAKDNKQEVLKIILNTMSSTDLPQKLELVDTLQRIGVDYHYRQEIDELLRDIYGDKHEIHDLYTAALRFYLLRKHGYPVSSDVFTMFVDGNRIIGSTDAITLLVLYNAAHLRTHGEKILDDLMTSTKQLLKYMVNQLDPTLAQEVQYTLETPLFRRLHRIEAKRYISTYEKKHTRNKTILEFAKLDYNIVQSLYCDELKDLTLWWNGFDIKIHLPWARDRMVEMHFWMMGVFFEPHYSYPRTMLTKLITLVSVFDDFYDNYSTAQESTMFTSAIDRWDEHAAEQVPTYMRPFYKGTVSTINCIEEDLKLQKNKHAELVKELVLKWRDQQYVPSNLEEHLQISVRSSGCMHISNLAFLLMGDVTPSETVQWTWTYPRIIRAVCIIGRVMNDITSHEREQASQHVVSTVQTYIKENGCTVQQANEGLNQIVEEAWMDINEGFMQPAAHPFAVLSRAVNLARTMDFMYKREDAYTTSSRSKILWTLYTFSQLMFEEFKLINNGGVMTVVYLYRLYIVHYILLYVVFVSDHCTAMYQIHALVLDPMQCL
ncbi:hypothetical protein VPH35_025172 [Triticum aestivum]